MLTRTGCIGRNLAGFVPSVKPVSIQAMSELHIREVDDAVTFEVRVVPRASRDRIVGARDGALRVALTAPPVDGAANEALRKLLAKALGVSKSAVEIVRGDRARVKLLRVRGVDAARVRSTTPTS